MISAGESNKEFRTLDAIERLFSIVDQKHPTHLKATAKSRMKSKKPSLETPGLKISGGLALITGGTRGIGAVTGKSLAELGADVVITECSLREGQRVVGEINCNGRSAEFIQADLTQPDQGRLVVPFTLKAFRRVDYAFNSAGISGNNGVLVDQTEENFDRAFAVSVNVLFLFLQGELKQLIVRGEGNTFLCDPRATIGTHPIRHGHSPISIVLFLRGPSSMNAALRRQPLTVAL